MSAGQKNFFIAGRPVWGDQFFGRYKLMEWLASLISGHSVILVGERRIGKTSILEQIRYLASRDIEDDNPSWKNAVLIRLDGFAFSQQDHPNAFAREIAKRLARWAQDQPPPIKNLSKKLTAKEVDYYILDDELREIKEKGYQITILFDEIDAGIANGPPRAAPIYRALASTGHIVTIATSYREPWEIEPPGSTAGSPLFNIFRIEAVGLFTEEEAKELLITLSKVSGNALREEECLFLIDVFGTFPFLLQMAGSYIFGGGRFATCQKHERIDIIKKSVIATSEQLSFHFASMVNQLNDESMHELLKVAKGEDVSLNQTVHRLLRRGLIIESADEQYRIFSRVFKEFLNEIPEEKDESKKESKVLQRVSSMAGKALEIAFSKAIEIAAKSYFP